MRKYLLISTSVFSLLVSAVSGSGAQLTSDLTDHHLFNGPIVRLYAANGTVLSGDWEADPRLKTLVRDLHPAVYIAEGAVKVREQRPLCLFLDAASLTVAEPKAFARGGIELITIDVRSTSELSQRLDLSALRGFGQLRYVHVRSSVLCQPEQLLAMVQNIPVSVKVLVTIEEPS